MSVKKNPVGYADSFSPYGQTGGGALPMGPPGTSSGVPTSVGANNPNTGGLPMDPSTTSASSGWINWDIGVVTPVAPASSLQSTGKKRGAPSTATVAALGSFLPVAYGTVQVPALLVNILDSPSTGKTTFFVLWCEGPIGAITQVQMNDTDLPNGTIITNYTGTQSQTVNSTLVSGYAAVIGGHQTGPTWNNALLGIAYSVITLDYGKNTSPPKFTATINGRNVYDPRKDSTLCWNLLTFTEDFSNAAWTKTRTTASAKTANGGRIRTTAQTNLITEDATASATHLVQQNVTLTASKTYTKSVYATVNPLHPRNFIYLQITDLAGTSKHAYFNISTGAIGNVSAGCTAAIESQGTGWYRCEFTFASATGVTAPAEVIGLAAADNTPSYTGDGVSGVYLWGAQTEIAPAVQEYFPVLTNLAAMTQRQTDQTTWAFSANAACILADFLSQPATSWGAGKTVLWSSVISTAQMSDTALGVYPNIEVQRDCNMLLDKPATIDSWKDTLRTAAGCFLAENQNVVKLIPDLLGVATQTFSDSDGTLIAITNLHTADATQLPTVIDLTWTDTTGATATPPTPWKDNTVTVKRIGVDTGTVPWRRSSVPMQWIQRYSQASREATERLNKLWLRSPMFDAEVFDEGLKTEVGDTIALNSTEHGFVSLLCKVFQVTPTDHGTWVLSVTKDDPGSYSLTVQTNPTIPAIALPDPSNVPMITGLVVAEDVYQAQTGYFASRWKIDWDDPSLSWPYVDRINVVVTQNGILKDSAQVARGATEYVTPSMAENLAYDISVNIISTVGIAGPVASVTATNSGKSALPTDVAILNGYDISGETHLQWTPSTDLDLTGYEIRYYQGGSPSWANATLLDRVSVPSLKYVTNGLVPPGATTFYIKALDSVRSNDLPFGQYSANAASCSVTVGTNPDSLVAATHTWTTPTLTAMVATGSSPQNWLTDYGTSWSTLFPTALSGFTNVLSSYFGTGVSTLLTETFDLGQAYAGLLTNNATWTDLSGVATVFIETSLDNVTFTQFSGQAAQINGRYVRFRITTTGVVLVTSMGSMQLSVVAASESGSVMTSTTGWVTVTLARKYSKVKTIQLTSDGSLGVANPVYDQNSITLVGDPRYVNTTYIPEDYVDEAYSPLGSFAVECFDNNDNLLARSTNYLFQGI
jgi:hypothetical protein